MITFWQLIIMMYVVQLTHSIEELVTGFPQRWFFRKLDPKGFLVFEIFHNAFWGIVIATPAFPLRAQLLGLFVLLMFANGVEHIVWALWKKRYVPGLLTAPLHVIAASAFVIGNVKTWM